MQNLVQLTTPAAMHAWAREQRDAGKRIGLVPTMGYLHEGHLSLLDEARRRSDVTVASIFVNPTQFGPNEDLQRYPRDLEGDLTKLAARGLNAVFLPSPEQIYPEGFNTYVEPTTMARGLCGASRPGHFRGVCTVVHILFRITAAQVAIFGEKDYQQLQVIRAMARDLWLDVEVVGMPIVRDPDGLAMSSRNAYLSPAERQQALALPRTLNLLREAAAAGERDAQALAQRGRQALREAPGVRLDYLEVVNAATLEPASTVGPQTRVLGAIYVGNTRLIDNLGL